MPSSGCEARTPSGYAACALSAGDSTGRRDVPSMRLTQPRIVQKHDVYRQVAEMRLAVLVEQPGKARGGKPRIGGGPVLVRPPGVGTYERLDEWSALCPGGHCLCAYG